jgi:hypothetical protein
MWRLKFFGATLVLAILSFLVTPVLAGWSVVALNTSGATNSEAYGVYAGQVVGYAGSSAMIWTTTGTISTTLPFPSGYSSDAAYGVYNGQQGGVEVNSSNNTQHAVIWSNTSASRTDLNPSGATSSSIFAVYNGQQAGWEQTGGFAGPIYAGYWSGTASSFVNLGEGYAYGIYNSQVVGYVIPGGACLWNGSASNQVILAPSGSSSSEALGVYNGEQVGWSYTSGSGGDHAALWSGSASSFVDLNPSAATSSSAVAVRDGYQVGWATISAKKHAAIWQGSAASWIDIHSYLPSKYVQSGATGIYDSGPNIWISGYGEDSGGAFYAYLWHYVFGSVSGTINLGPYVGDKTKIPVVIEVRDSTNSTILETHTMNMDSTGKYSFNISTMGLTGNHYITAKPSHWLAKGLLVNLSGGADTANFTVANGDINGDNYVEDQDYSLMGLAWYSLLGDANYDANADLNGDGAVEDQDYSLLGLSWYQSGDPF